MEDGVSAFARKKKKIISRLLGVMWDRTVQLTQRDRCKSFISIQHFRRKASKTTICSLSFQKGGYSVSVFFPISDMKK